MTKICRSCKKEKPEDEFDMHTSRPVRVATCIECLENRLSGLTEKLCKKCNAIKPISEYRIDTRRRIPRIHCKPCESVVKKKWHGNNKESHKENLAMNRYKKYGLTDEDIEKVKGVTSCQVCGSTRRLCVDHCHDRMIFRGVLCSGCNTALGMVKDSPETLRGLAEYIEQFLLKP